MRKLITFALIFSIFFISQAYASCIKQNVPSTNIYTDMGRVIVSPNLKVGDIIAQQSWHFSRINRAFLCQSIDDNLDGEVVMTNLSAYNGTIFQTNIPGIGIQFMRADRIYPYTFSIKNNNTYVSVTAENIIVTLYKTAEYVGSGAIAPGLYTKYGIKSDVNGSILNTYMSQNGTTIVSPSCVVDSRTTQDINLASINYNQLKSVGSTAGEIPLSIQLKCSGGSSTNTGYNNINLTFSGSPPTGMKNSDGVLANTKTSSDAAQGIGIQILGNNKKPLEFNKKQKIGPLANTANHNLITSNYTVSYYRYAKNITGGEVEAKMVFNITYD
ncbi:fimbrial protein [Orbus sturtevantii]|uniref:fimbrial protein n=1 Tax=Orbus sturtevantii TaxID=3074109 RepID=UPI00370CFF3D